MKRNIFIFLLIILFAPAVLFSSTEIKKEQTESIKRVLNKANPENLTRAAEIVNYIDDVYGSLN